MDKFIESRPQELCLMCGRCCKMATTPVPYQELLKLVEEGDEGAKDFLSLFEPYPSIEEARKVFPDIVDNAVEKWTMNPDNKSELTFYKCRYIADNNLCSRYKDRPALCGRFPTSPWAVVPPGCGFEGWIFKRQEEFKQKIRKQKETILELEAMLPTLDNPEQIEKVKEAIEKTKQTIALFAKYGSADW